MKHTPMNINTQNSRHTKRYAILVRSAVISLWVCPLGACLPYDGIDNDDQVIAEQKDDERNSTWDFAWDFAQKALAAVLGGVAYTTIHALADSIAELPSSALVEIPAVLNCQQFILNRYGISFSLDEDGNAPDAVKAVNRASVELQQLSRSPRWGDVKERKRLLRNLGEALRKLRDAYPEVVQERVKDVRAGFTPLHSHAYKANIPPGTGRLRKAWLKGRHAVSYFVLMNIIDRLYRAVDKNGNPLTLNPKIPGTQTRVGITTQTSPQLRAAELCGHYGHVLAGTSATFVTGAILTAITTFNLSLARGEPVNIMNPPPLPKSVCLGMSVSKSSGEIVQYTAVGLRENDGVEISIARNIPIVGRTLDGTLMIAPSANEQDQIALNAAGPYPDGTGAFQLTYTEGDWKSKVLVDDTLRKRRAEGLCSLEERGKEETAFNAAKSEKKSFSPICNELDNEIIVRQVPSERGVYEVLHREAQAQRPTRTRLFCTGDT